MASNGSAAGQVRRIPFRPGLYAPVVTIFHQETEDLDLEAQSAHAVRLAKAGLVGLVALGSNGEAVHLDAAERANVIRATRDGLDAAGFGDVPVIAGCSAQSVRETIALCRAAAAAGASYAICLPPCYYRPEMTGEVIEGYFRDVADKSPIGVLMYNYPGAVAGVDLNSDVMIRLAKHPNIVGAKLTCANTGKLTRLATATNAISPKSNGSGFLATGGLADMTVPVAAIGGSGIIAGTANVLPKLCVRVWDLWTQGKQEEATELQKLLAKADWELAKSVVPATKATLRHYFGYGGVPRRPLPALLGAAGDAHIEGIAEAIKVENTL